MNDSGKMTMKLALLNTSGVRIQSPTTAMTHDNAYAKNRSSAYPATASRKLEWMRHPTRRPVNDMTTKLMTLINTSLDVRPVSTADGAMGSDRNLSMIPF